MSALFARDKEYNGKLYIVLFLILTGILCLRYGQGTDYIGYQMHYSRCPDFLTSKYFMADSSFEKGYRFLMNLFRSLGCSFEVFIMVIAIFDMWMLNRFIKRYCGDRCLALVLFFSTFYLTYYFSAMRQGIALAVFIGFGVPLLIDKKWIKYTIAVCIAASVHKSAYILLSVPLLIRLRPKTLLILIMLTLGTAIVLNAVGIHGKILTMFDRTAYENREIGWAALIRKGVELAMVITLYKEDKERGDINLFLKLYYIGAIVTMFFFNNSLILSRLTIYFDVMAVALLSTAINNVHRPNISIGRLSGRAEWTYLLAVIAIGGFMTIKNIDSYISQGSYYNKNLFKYPYISVFEKDKLYSYRASDYVDYIKD